MSTNDLGDYVDLVLHDLTSPLSTMQLWLSVLRTTIDDGVARERAIAALESGARVQTRLLEDLRDLSSALRRVLPLANDRPDLRAIVIAAFDRIRPEATARDCEIREHVAPELRISGDYEILVRVLERLLGSMVAQSRGGRIVVTGNEDCEEVVCAISRTPADGPGVHASLALLFAREMIALHDGALDVRDKGRRFVLRLRR